VRDREHVAHALVGVLGAGAVDIGLVVSSMISIERSRMDEPATRVASVMDRGFVLAGQDATPHDREREDRGETSASHECGCSGHVPGVARSRESSQAIDRLLYITSGRI